MSHSTSTETYANRYDLDKLPVFLEGSGEDSMFLEVKGLPDLLTYGKHYITVAFKDLKNSPYYLRENSGLQFEVKDSNNNVIYSDIGTTSEILDHYSGAAIIYIWVKEDPLRTYKPIKNGMGTLTFVGELSGEGIPIEWKGKKNYRCTFPIEIRKELPNLSPILFQSASLIQQTFTDTVSSITADPKIANTPTASISESIGLDFNDSNYKRSYIHISASHLGTFGGKVEFIEVSYNENNSLNNEFKILTTYPLTSSITNTAVYETSASSGLNPLSTLQEIPIPREIRRNGNVTFKLKFLNKNLDYAQDISKTNDVLEITTSLAITGSPLILETNDNLVTGSGKLVFGKSLEEGIKLEYVPEDESLKMTHVKEGINQKVLQEFRGTKGGFTLGGDASSHKVEGKASSSAILAGTGSIIFNSNQASILSGVNNEITLSDNSSIVAGEDNKIIAVHTELIDKNGGWNTIVGGTTSKIVSSSLATIGGGGAHQILDTKYATIAGGFVNFISGSHQSVIVGGTENVISASLSHDSDNCFIGAGNKNRIMGSHNASIISGDQNRISQSQGAIIIGGTLNFISGSGRAFIGGGENNQIIDDDAHSTQMYNTIPGGQGNKIDSGYRTLICGGNGNIITKGSYAVIGGGSNNDITMPSVGLNNYSNAGILSGWNNTVISGSTYQLGGNVIAGGAGNKINAISNYGGAFIGSGYNNEILNSGLTMIGGAFIGQGYLGKINQSPGSFGGSLTTCEISLSKFSFIGAGRNNDIHSAPSSSIIGSYNTITHGNSHIIGTHLNSTQEDTTYVNNLIVTGSALTHSFGGGTAYFDGPVTASGNISVGGDLTIEGSITAQEFHTEITSASIIFTSGSTKFGDSADDTHVFTGSLSGEKHLLVEGDISASGKIYSDDEIHLIDAGGDTLVKMYASGDDGIIDVYANNSVMHRIAGTTGGGTSYIAVGTDTQPAAGAGGGAIGLVVQSAISSSTDIYAGQELFVFNNAKIGTGVAGGSLEVDGHITASGNISSSGTLIGGGLNVNGTTTFNDGNITNVGDITLDSISDDATGGDTVITLNGTQISVDVAGATNQTLEQTLYTVEVPTYIKSHITASGNISASGIVYGSQAKFESNNGTLLELERNDSQNAAIKFTNTQGYMIAGIDNDAHNTGANVFGIGYHGDIIDSDGSDNATFVVTGSQVVINQATTASNGATLTVGGDISATGNISQSNSTSTGSFGFGVIRNKLGVGTHQPDYDLDVAGTVGVANYIYHNGDEDTHILMETDMINLVAGGKSIIKGDEDEGWIRINNTNANLDTQIMADDGEVVFHLDAGTNRVGISSSAPPKTLTVGGDISASGDFYLQSTKKAYLNPIEDTYLDSDSTDRIRFVAGGQQMLVLDYDTGNRAAFGDTKVGIGLGDNHVPSHELEVDGEISASGNFYLNVGNQPDIKMGRNVAGDMDGIVVKGDISASGNFYLIPHDSVANTNITVGTGTIDDGGAYPLSGSGIRLFGPNTSSGSLLFLSSNKSWEIAHSKLATGMIPNALHFRRNGTDHIIFDGDGSVGIGTGITNQTGNSFPEKLTVEGSISASGALMGVTSASTAHGWTDGFHGNDEYIPLLPSDFSMANHARNSPFLAGDGIGAYLNVTNGNYTNIGMKIIPKGFTAWKGVVYGNDTGNTHRWYSSSISLGTSDTATDATEAIATIKTFDDEVVGDGATYVTVVVDSDTNDDIYGGAIYIKRTT